MYHWVIIQSIIPLGVFFCGQLKKLGVDAEAVKKDFIGGAGGKFNISVDDAGSVFLTPVRKGESDLIPTFSTLDDLITDFPLKR